MRETVYINLSLLALKKCIEALNHRQSYIPYQDSKLTMLLSAGLGNGKTSIIICSSNDHHIHETISTLRFGEKCSEIEMTLHRDDDSKGGVTTVLESMLLALDTEIQILEKLIIKKERWEIIEEKRIDKLAEDDTVEKGQGGIEVRYVTILCGAEDERYRLDELIRQRAELTGSNYLRQAFQTGEKVIAFGKKMTTYGKRYNPSEELKVENERFKEKPDESAVPLIVRARGKGWKMGKELDVAPEVLEKKAWTTKRNKAVYSGLS
jgi:hypothetical protein